MLEVLLLSVKQWVGVGIRVTFFQGIIIIKVQFDLLYKIVSGTYSAFVIDLDNSDRQATKKNAVFTRRKCTCLHAKNVLFGEEQSEQYGL